MCPDLWITIASLLFDLNYEFINGSFAFSPGLIYILYMATFAMITELRVRGAVSQQSSLYPLVDHSFVSTYEHRYSQSFQCVTFTMV